MFMVFMSLAFSSKTCMKISLPVTTGCLRKRPADKMFYLEKELLKELFLNCDIFIPKLYEKYIIKHRSQVALVT